MTERKNGTRAKNVGGRRPAAHQVRELPIVSAIRKFSGRAIESSSVDQGLKRIFVLDTNVLMHDPSCLFRFAEHDVFIPMMTLDELDNHKKGKDDINRNVREVTRTIKEMTNMKGCKINEGIDLSGLSKGLATGRLFLQTENMEGTLPTALPMTKVDHQILSVITYMQSSEAFKGYLIILVTKDINMYIKAKALGYMVEDYLNDKVIEDTDLLYSGALELPDNFWDTLSGSPQVKKDRESGISTYRIKGPICSALHVNQLLWSDALKFECIVREVYQNTAVLQTLVDYRNPKHAVFGITAKNCEQNFALNLLLDPNIDLVSLLGQAGTGKTLLAVAAGLLQAIEGKRFGGIIMTRVTVSVGEDIGFLPGTEEEKMGAWMGALEDNLEVLVSVAGNQFKKSSGYSGSQMAAEIARTEKQQQIKDSVKVKSLNFMRGRTFFRKYLIIDEAQNLTPKQMKTLITRAGLGTKVVCLGNIGQIDSPYLTEGSSGLTYMVDRFKGREHTGHIILQRGERSRLADLANEVL